MFILYNLIHLLVFPFFFIFYVTASYFKRKWRKGALVKAGFYGAAAPEGHKAVFHCVSVGETLAATPLIRQFVSEVSRNVAVTVTTATGYAVALKNLGSLVRSISFFPFDFPLSVSSFYRYFKPSAVIITETEIWPNIIWMARSRSIPVVFVNGRISDRSFPRYEKTAWFFRSLLHYPYFLMQTETDRQRILAMGASGERVFVTGNIKYDFGTGVKAISRETLGFIPGDTILVAGSTHQGEDVQIAECYLALLPQFPRLKLIVAPRHPERFEEVMKLLRDRGISVTRRSSGGPAGQALLLDTVGELLGVYGAADIAFVGGSLVDVGGHNILEPACFGVPVVFGPYMQNFRAIRDEFVAGKAGFEVTGPADLADVIGRLISDEQLRKETGIRGREILERNRGSMKRSLDIIRKITGNA